MSRRAQPWLGTRVEITLNDAGHGIDSAAFSTAFATIRSVHQAMSFQDPASDISRLNRAAVNESVEIASSTVDVLKFALQLATLSDGLFDIACAPRLVEWGYLPAPSAQLPRPAPGFSPALLILEPGRVYKTAPAWIDVGGVAKGYAVDQAVMVLKNAGVQSGCVNAGGDLRVFGSVPQSVRIRDPAAPDCLLAEWQLNNEALASSAHYFSKRWQEGRWVSALVDGRNAQPTRVTGGVSIRAPTCMVADGLTKVVMASGDVLHPACLALGAQAIILKDNS